jgi:hypothetical protein
VADAEDRNQRIVPIEERFFGGGDLGDVELGPVRSLSLVVRDRAGAPVQGAVAVAATGRTRRPTDAEGRGSLELAGPEDSIEVGALGYGVVDVPIPPGVPEPVVVTLAPQALLVVHVLGPTGEAPRGLWVEVAGNEGDCTEPDLRGAHRACGGLPAAILECEAMFTTTASHPVGEAGMLRFPDLHADRPLTVFLRDASGLSLDSRPVTLAPEETRHVTLRCDRTPRDFHGIVTDPRGRPVEEADVLLRRDSSGAGFLHRTGPDGSFRIEALYAETVGLEVSKDGFAVLVAPGRRIAPAGAPEVFRLEQGHPVLLTVLDAAGRRFAEADSIDALVPSASEGTTRVGGIESLEPGVFRVTSLPTGTVRLRLGIAGRSYEIAHEASTPEARLIVPCHGSLVARWSLAGGPAPRSVRLVPEAEEGGQYFHLPNDGPLVGEHRVAAVHPGVYRVRLALPVPDTYDTVELEERVTVLPDATVEVTFRR